MLPLSVKGKNEQEMEKNDCKTQSRHRVRGRGTAAAVEGAIFAPRLGLCFIRN